MIGDHCIGRRNATGLANADAQPGQEDRPEALGEAGQRREAAPDRQRYRDHPASAGLVCDPGQRHRQRGIEQGKGDAAEQPHLGVAQAKIGLDRAGQDRQDLPVDEIEDIDKQQHAQRDIGRGRPAGCCGLPGHLVFKLRMETVDRGQRLRLA